MLTPFTTILCWSGMVRSTSPCCRLSLPAMTITGSPGARSSQRRVGCSLFLSTVSENLRGERDDLHEVALAQLTCDRSEDSGAARVVGCGEKDGGVLVEADQGAIRALVFLVYPHDDSLNHLALLNLAAGLDRLVHLVRDHGAEADLAPAARGRGSCLSGGVAHSAVSFFRPRPRFGLGASSSCTSSAWTSSGASATATATAPGVSSSKLGAMP